MKYVNNSRACNARIEEYFASVREKPNEPALLTGLALFLGFNSRQQFDDYCINGRRKKIVKKARLRIEAEYERRVLQQAPTGAIFALKSFGWGEKDTTGNGQTVAKLVIEIINAGPVPAASEKEVIQ